MGVLSTVGGVQSTTLNPSAAAIPAALANATGDASNPNDARFWLILEARVVADPATTDVRGLAQAAVHVGALDTRARGNFAGTPATSGGGLPFSANAAAATTAIATLPGPGGPGVVLPAGVTALPGEPSTGSRGVFGPFRGFANTDQRGVGMSNEYVPIYSGTGITTSNPTLANLIALTDQTTMLSPTIVTGVDEQTGEPVSGPNPFYQQWQYAGLNTWVPLFSMVYNITEVSTARTVSLLPVVNPAVTLSLRVSPTGAPLSANLLTLGSVPRFNITVVPAPCAGAAVLMGALGMARRRRRASVA